MAKTNKTNKGFTQPQGFTHGMISDVDPHFQLKGSYSDAQNIRLTNSSGNTFTAENIEGNSLFVDLKDVNPHRDPTYLGSNGPAGLNYFLGNGRLYDFGPDGTYTNNRGLHNDASIVGHVSYANQILLVIVVRYEYTRLDPGDASVNTKETHNRTLFWLLDFDDNFNFIKATDLEVCWSTENANYPDLNMDLDTPIRIEKIIENGCISRIYWTDNKNPLRTLNLNQKAKNKLSIESLNITPLMKPSQPTLNLTISGSLPVGVYQYVYKYISENGGETTFSPLSNLYHVSDQAFGSTVTYGGGPKGNLGTQGFSIKVYDIDNNFDYLELYTLLYEGLNSAPRVALVGRNRISGSTESEFQHVSWNNELDNGLEEVLIETNTWDICKDIAIKDNILFAANLKQKRNWITEKEWNVKVMRWRIESGDATTVDAMLTTTDTQVKHYQDTGSGPVEITNGTQDFNSDYCGHGVLLTENHADASGHVNHDGTANNPMWTTCLENQRNGSDLGSGLDPKTKTKLEYRYLSDRMTCGAESFDYVENGLGGCRITFGVDKREADQSQNTSTSPYVSATISPESALTEKTNNYYVYVGQSGNPVPATGSNDNNTETKFVTSMALGGSRDPHVAGNRRGYQRGEIYRFGVQVYDLNGGPANVLWIGDIQMPEQYDPLRQLKWYDGEYTPFRPTHYTASDGASPLTSSGKKLIISSSFVMDHRLSYVYGHIVAPVDVEWFTNHTGNGVTNTAAYVKHTGDPMNTNHVPGVNTDRSPGGRVKGATIAPGQYNTNISSFDNTHYLFDLYVNFEFLIPVEVCKKISGFRVVRAERTEEDRRIIQQGLLNQTIQYGESATGLDAGYGNTKFCTSDNEAFGDDPVFVNQENATNPTEVEQPEFNTYLNGYLGLAENSNLAYYKSGATDGKVTSGGVTDGEIYAWPEREDAKRYGNRPTYPIPNTDSSGSSYGDRFIGPGSVTTLRQHTSYFGSIDKRETYDGSGTGGKADDEPDNHAENTRMVSGSIYTLDAPDSAFGTRPYVFKDGDHLRIDSILKITNEKRYLNGSSGHHSGRPGYYFSHSAEFQTAASGQTGRVQSPPNPNDKNDLNLSPEDRSKTDTESLKFASKRHIDNDYSILIAKYYCYEPYFGIGMEMDGGKHIADAHDGNDTGAESSFFCPGKAYGYALPLAAAKEISDGEIVPSGFFKKSYHTSSNLVSGFSNNTLGFCRTYLSTRSDSGGRGKQHKVFDAVHQSISKLNDGGANPHSEVKEEDYTYDTISTMQMGLRSILLEVNTKVAEVKKHGPGSNDSNFENRSANINTRYDSWFACPDISRLYEQGHWFGVYKNGTTQNPGNSFNLVREHSIMTRNKLTLYMESDAKDFVSQQIGDSDTSSASTGNSNQWRELHPHKFLCSIVRRVIPYGGFTKNAIEKTRYIACGNFNPVNTPSDEFEAGTKRGYLSRTFGGDTFVNLYTHQKTSAPYMKKSAARWQIFPVETYVNTDMRSGLTLNNGDTTIGKEMNKPPFSNDWLYNNVYSQENSIKSGLMIDEDDTCENLDLPYEIAYSNTKVSGEPGDAFRTFPINQFHDMEGLYGEINRIVNFKNEIYIIQDTAFAKLLVNPLSMLSDDTGTSLFTGTGETVENHIYISTKYGTRHRFSVSMSEKSLYFVDSNFGRLFKYDTEKLVSLGDALGQRNYFRYIIKDWEKTPRKLCTIGSHNSFHQELKGKLDSSEKAPGNRNYFADNPLKFLGITTIFDYKNKELLVTFHNSSWTNTSAADLSFADENCHIMGSTVDGIPAKVSETIVYNESINAFTSKYSVAPPQWLSGSEGSFILCPENELAIQSLTNRSWNSNGTYDSGYQPYYQYGSINGGIANNGRWYKNYRPNPLRLWLWDKHEDGKKTNFFGKKDDILTLPVEDSIIDDTFATESHITVEEGYSGFNYVADESYIEKVINTEAGERKVFDNVAIIMTPSEIPLSNTPGYSFADFKTEVTDYNYAVLKNKWMFENSSDGWSFYDDGEIEATGVATVASAPVVVTGCTDSTATNYNSNATVDNGLCIYGPIITGCTDSTAQNYNSNANVNDGSCNFIVTVNGCTDPNATNYNSVANTDDGTCTYPIFGCTDSFATNYNPLATDDSGLCEYPAPINGCTDSTASNYNSNANTDDGSCVYPVFGCTDPSALNYDVTATNDDGSCVYPVFGCTNPAAVNYDSTATDDDGSCCLNEGCTDPTANNFDPTACSDDGSCTYNTGCTDSTAFNYDSAAVVDNGSCIAIVLGCMDSGSSNYDPAANTDNGTCVPCIYGCTFSGAFNYNSAATCDATTLNPGTGVCISIVLGCVDSSALNYNSLANTDDGSCISVVNGCTDSNAINYNSSANVDNGSCAYTSGCTDSTASNYNSNADLDDGSCIPCAYGCTNTLACNYDINATCDDGSCITPDGCGDSNAMNYNSNTICSDLSLCLYQDGCTDSNAVNYNSNAPNDDGSCYYTPGCTDSTACNYNSLADFNDGSCFTTGPNEDCNGNCIAGYVKVNGACVLEVLGCTDSNADNYNSTANVDDGSCTYTAAQGVAAAGHVTDDYNGGTCTSCRFTTTNGGGYSGRSKGSHYDTAPYLGGYTLPGTWTGPNGTIYTDLFSVINWQDLNTSTIMHWSQVNHYINGTGNWVGDPHPAPNWAITRATCNNYSDPSNSQHTHGPCVYNNGTEVLKGSGDNGTLVTFAAPTNPYNLP